VFLFYKVLLAFGMVFGVVIDHILFAVVFRIATNETPKLITRTVAALVYVGKRLLEIVDVPSFYVLFESLLDDVLGPDLDFRRGYAGWIRVA
jgi:hypothetical protein